MRCYGVVKINDCILKCAIAEFSRFKIIEKIQKLIQKKTPLSKILHYTGAPHEEVYPII